MMSTTVATTQRLGGWRGRRISLETRRHSRTPSRPIQGPRRAAPTSLLYFLTRLGDFAFSIAGVVMIAVTAGAAGLRQLGPRLVRSIGRRWYAVGLRGIALPRMQETMAPLRASLIIGVPWRAWHVPVLIGRSVLPVVAFFLVAQSASVLSTWMFNGSGGSLVPVLLFHAAANWEAPAVLGLLMAGVAEGTALWPRSAHAAH